MANFELLFFSSFLLAFWGSAWAASNTNPADELAGLINSNRTASKLASLVDNPGLACVALQYVHDFQQACDEVGKEMPLPDLLNTTFAASCGVEPATVATLTGSLVYCQSSYVGASEAFGLLLGSSNRSKAVIDNANHTEFGVAVGSYGGGSPYYWGVLFSDGAPASTYVFASGKARSQHEGCFSGTGDPCSGSSILRIDLPWLLLLLAIATSLQLS